jgi:hypothetical protein
LHDFFVEGLLAKEVLLYMGGITIASIYAVCHGFIQYYLDQVDEETTKMIKDNEAAEREFHE